ncbi:hypothetical protein [Gracilimonas sp.]|uniref:hypothetical protein n=1 Tax=Gracilimonas sp. TaxID=1974203 RepID=UPI002872907B|nr:hypothetical protein [Gracilimonas sp.]
MAICLSFWAGFFTLSNAQQSEVGIVWEVPGDTYSAQIELGAFKTLGVTHIEIPYPVSEEIKPLLRDSSFSFLIRSPQKFLTVSGLQQQRSSLRTTITELGREYSSYANVSGIGVVTHSQTDHPDFLPSVNSILSTAVQEIDTPFYFVQNQNWYWLSSPENPFAVYFDDSEYQRSDLKDFSDFMSENGQDKIQIINSNWLLEATNDFPEIETALKEFTASGNWMLPHPNTKETTLLKANWMVLIFIFLWASLTLQIRFLPYVRSVIIRYFFAHRFFVDDILGYRERAVAGGILQMITHAIFGGLVFFMASHLLFSDLGIEAIFHYFPWLSLTVQNYYSFFVFGFGITLVFQLLALIWLHLPAKNLTHFSQTLNLYSGIFYIDYIIVTIMLTLFTAGAGHLFTLGFAVAFLLIWYLSFYITAFDIAQNNRDNKALYLLLTVVLYSLIIVTLLVVVLLFTDVISVFKLAAYL